MPAAQRSQWRPETGRKTCSAKDPRIERELREHVPGQILEQRQKEGHVPGEIMEQKKIGGHVPRGFLEQREKEEHVP